MEPTLRNGQRVWIFQWAYLFQKPKKGDIILFEREDKAWLKRISDINKQGIWVEGDNSSDSLDSRQFGQIEKKQIIGKLFKSKRFT